VGLGPHTITVTATHDATNSNTCTTTFTVVAATPPSVTCPAGTSANANGTCQAAVPNVLPGVTATDNCDPSLTLSQSPTAGTLVGPGVHTITVTATDDANNSNACTTTFTVADATPPSLTCPANKTVNTDPGVCTAVVNGINPTYSDNCSATLSYLLTGATVGSGAGSASGKTFNKGSTTVKTPPLPARPISPSRQAAGAERWSLTPLRHQMITARAW